MTTPYLHSDHFPNSSPAAAAQLAEDLEHLLAADYRGDLYAMLAGWQRVLADNRKRRQWPELHRKLATLFRCGRTAVVDGPMIGVSLSIRDSDYFRETARLLGRERSLAAAVEWMATAWNLTFADTGLWMGKTFEPVSRAVVAERTANDPATLAGYDETTFRIGRNFFRPVADPSPVQALGLPVLTRLWRLKPRPLTTGAELFGGRLLAAHLERERAIPYTMTGGVFLAEPGVSVVPEMRGKPVFQLNYRWPLLEPAYPMTRLIDELVQIGEGIYLGQLVFATRHYSLGRLDLAPAAGSADRTAGGLFADFSPAPGIDYGYQNNGFFLMLDPVHADLIYADTAFPWLRPRPGESGFAQAGVLAAPTRRSAPPAAAPGRWPAVRDWVSGWREDAALHAKFTTLLSEPSPRPEDNDGLTALRHGDESILQMLQRLGGEISAATAVDDQLERFAPLHRLFRCGIAPRVVDGSFQGHGRPGYNCRVDGSEPRPWYGRAEVARSFDFYHGATLVLHGGLGDGLRAAAGAEEGLFYPGALATLLTDATLPDKNRLDLVWRAIGRYLFPWAGKSFERISGRKLSMLLDESPDLAERYPERVSELQSRLASRPHYRLVRRAARGDTPPGVHAPHLAAGPWHGAMSAVDRAWWEQEAAAHWVDGNNIQDERILSMDALMRAIDLNYRVPDPALQALSATGPSPFVRQGYCFLGVSGRQSALAVNNHGDRRKTVFQFHYRYPLIGGPAPIGLCLDELVEIADGLFLGQLIYATALDVPFHSALDPAVYNYQLFGYFLLLDDAWEYHRQAIGLDVWRR